MGVKVKSEDLDFLRKQNFFRKMKTSLRIFLRLPFLVIHDVSCLLRNFLSTHPRKTTLRSTKVESNEFAISLYLANEFQPNASTTLICPTPVSSRLSAIEAYKGSPLLPHLFLRRLGLNENFPLCMLSEAMSLLIRTDVQATHTDWWEKAEKG